jgi:hypothetical protein
MDQSSWSGARSKPGSGHMRRRRPHLPLIEPLSRRPFVIKSTEVRSTKPGDEYHTLTMQVSEQNGKMHAPYFLSFFFVLNTDEMLQSRNQFISAKFFLGSPIDRSVVIEQMLAAGQFTQVDACSTSVDAGWSHLWPPAAARTRQE